MNLLASLAPDDFPLSAIGDRVYRRTWSAPLLTALTDQLAADIAARLNRDWLAQTGVGASSGGFVSALPSKTEEPRR